jgi:uncharacterized membrane protein
MHIGLLVLFGFIISQTKLSDTVRFINYIKFYFYYSLRLLILFINIYFLYIFVKNGIYKKSEI